MRFECVRDLVCGTVVVAKQVRPADDGIQRACAVRGERGEEFVLEAMGFPAREQEIGAFALRALDVGMSLKVVTSAAISSPVSAAARAT